MPYQRLPGKFDYSGMDIHHPPDRLPEGKCSLLFNLTPDTQTGALALRPALSSLATTPDTAPVHSVVRMNDSVPGAAQPFSRFVGCGPRFYYGPGGALTLLDSGFSSNPLALVPYRPPRSPEPWLYTYDSNKQVRYKTDGTTQQIGIVSPTTEPLAQRTAPLYKLIGNMEDATAGTWSGINASGGIISAPANALHVPAATTITKILYDTGTSGMACVAPSSTSNGWVIGGASVTIGAEQVIIEETFPAMAATTVSAIQYDTGLNGLCVISPVASLPGLRRNQLLLLNGATYVRVLSVTAGPNGVYSFRCDTGFITISATQTITSPVNFRVWTTSTHVNGDAITGNAIAATLTPIGGTVMSAVLYGGSFSADATQIGTRAVVNEDYIHIGLLFDHPEWVTEVRVMLDVDLSGPAFTNNFYYYVLRQSDFAQSTLGGSSPGQVSTIQAQLTAIQYGVASELVPSVLPQAEQPPYPTPQNPASSEPNPQVLDTGQSSWVEAMFKVNDLTRVGTDESLGLKDIANGIGILVYTSGGVVNMQVSGLWVGGTYGPDCNFNTYGNQAPPIQWRYRYRNNLTGAHSTVSPEVRNGEILRRQAVSLTCPNSPDPQVDTVDWERRGGTNPDWHYVGSVPQGTAFLDNVTEAAAQIGDPLEVTSYQPWPVTDTPKVGTAVVVGTAVGWVSGPRFNVRWLRGTEVILGGNTYSLFAPPQSDTDMMLAQSVPPGTYDFSVPEATIEGQPMYGGWLDEANNRICAVGDPLNPGLMYFSNVDNPDGASDAGYIEITSPSEPLLNGFYAEGSNYVFSSTSLYRVESTPGAVNPYAAYRLAGLEGLAAPWAFDASRRLLFWWGPDGIYVYSFGAAGENLTAQDLYPLFPHAGQSGQPGIPGVPVSIAGNVIFPPAYNHPQLLRIGYSESQIYATYQDSNGSVEALVYSLGSKGWRKYEYKPGATVFVFEKGVPNPLTMVGGSDGNLYKIDSTATADAGGTIGWVVLPPVRDTGDSRANKQFGDMMIDYGTATSVLSLNVAIFWDDLLVAGPVTALGLSSDRTQQIIDLITPPQYVDLPIIHRNVTPLITGNGPVFLYEWQPSYLTLPEDSTARPTDWQTGSTPGFKWINGVVIHADTYGNTKQFKVEYDNQQTAATFAVSHLGEQRLPYYFPPVYAHELRLVPQDDIPWHDWMDEQWVGNPEPEYGGELAVNWNDGGRQGFKWVNGILLHLDTFNRPKQLQIQFEGGNVAPINITVQANGEETLPYYWLPVYVHMMRIVPMDGGTPVPWRYWQDSQYLFNAEPEYGGQLAVNWVNAGVNQFKWINGFKLHADTFGQDKRIQILYDGGTPGPILTINHPGEDIKPYYWVPIYAHQIKIIPLDDVPWRYWVDTDWLFNQEPEYGGQLAVNWVSGGQPGFKWVNGILLHADTFGLVKRLQIQFDGGSNPTEIDVQHNGEETLPYYFTPVYAHEMRIIPLDDVVWRYWPDTGWLFNNEPEYGGQLAVNWVNAGTPHYKYVQGIRLHADTFNQTKRIQILYDGGIVGPVLTITHNGEQTIPYSWPVPFKAHLMKIIPLDNVSWRYWNDTEWVFEIEPELANYWISQPTALGQSGYIHAREFWLAFATASAGGVVSAIVDGVMTTLLTLPAAPTPSKQYFVCPPLKGLYWQLTATGTGLQIYERDCELLVKSWGSTAAYMRVKPFGDTSGGGGSSGARI